VWSAPWDRVQFKKTLNVVMEMEAL
jgi:hypothetical protein